MLSVIMLNDVTMCVVMLRVDLLSLVTLSVIILNVVGPSVVAPLNGGLAQSSRPEGDKIRSFRFFKSALSVDGQGGGERRGRGREGQPGQKVVMTGQIVVKV